MRQLLILAETLMGCCYQCSKWKILGNVKVNNIRAFRGQNNEIISRQNGPMILMHLKNRNGIAVHFEPWALYTFRLTGDALTQRRPIGSILKYS